MSRIPNSINVGQQIAPNYTDDTFALFDPIYGIGGLREVANLTERNNISAERLRIGMLVYVTSENKFYRLVSFSENQNPPYDIITNWENVIFLNNSGQTISGVKTFANRPNVNGTGFLLSGDISEATLPDTIVHTSGNQTISGIKTFADRPTVNGTGFLLSGEVIGLINGIQTFSGAKTFNVRPNLNGTPFLLSGELSLPSTIVYTTGDQTLSGSKTFASRPNVNGTGFLLSGEVLTLPTTVVYTTGDQTLSGSKTFASRPNVNGTGVLLSGELFSNKVVYTTGNQTISGNKTFANYLLFGNQNGIGGSISGSQIPESDSNLFIDGGGGASYIHLTTSQASMTLGEGGISINAANEAFTINNTDGIYINGAESFISAPDTTASFKNVSVNNLLNITDTGNYQVGYISGESLDDGDISNLYIKTNGGGEKRVILQAEGHTLTLGRDGGLSYGNNQFLIDGNSENLVVQNADVYVEQNAYASNLVYNVGDQIISGNKTFVGDISINNLTVTGTRTIANTQENNIDSNYLLLNITGGATNGGIYFVTGAGFSGVNSSGPIIAYDSNIDKFRIGTGIRSTNINSLKTIAAVEDVVTLAGNQTISGNKTFANPAKFNAISGDFSLDISTPYDLTLRNSIGASLRLGGEEKTVTLSGDEANFHFTNLDIYSPTQIRGKLDGSTGIFQKLYADNLIYNTGNQTISGFKTFAAAGDLIISGNGDDVALIKSLKGNLTIEGANSNYGIQFSDEAVFIKGNTEINNDLFAQTGTFQKLYADNLVYNTGDQAISGNKNFTNGLNINNNPLFYSQPSGFFSGVAVTGSGDGGYFIGRTKISQNTLILKDESFGKNNITKESIRNWQSVAISADGKYQSAVANTADYIYISSDYGDTWQQKASSLNWFKIAMSADGKYQTASTYNTPFGYLYTSDNYGHTWTQIPTNETSIQDIAMSSDGKIQIFVTYTTSEYKISRDYGKTWTNGTVNSTSGVKGVAISSDGKYITIVGAGGNDRIYTSSNYGLNWTTIGSIGTWNSVTMSADGKFQAAVTGGTGYVYISNDYGNTWTRKNNAGSRSWLSISMSSDGKYIAATTNGNYNYVSTDYGENWTVSYINNRQAGSFYVCNDIAVSSNGKYTLTAAQAQYIYVSKTEEKLDGNLYTDNVYGNNLVYTSGNQTISGVKTFASRPTVNGTGVLLSGEFVALPNTIVYTTGTQSIDGIKTFGGGIALSTISADLSNSASIEFGDDDNITISAGSQVYMASPFIQTSPANLGAKVLFGDYNQVTPFEFVNIHGGNLLVDRTGIFLSGIDLKNSKLNNASNVIYNTGNQTISGEKTFKTRPTVNGSGVLLVGDNLGTFPSSSDTINVQTGNFYQLNTNNLVVTGTATFNNIDLSEIDSVYVSGADIFVDYSGFKFFKITPSGIFSNLSINIGNTNINSGSNNNFILHQEGNIISSGDTYSSIINGIVNTIATNSGTRNNIYGGFGNTINSGSDNFIIGGGSNEIYGSNSFILGGGLNHSSGITQKLFTHFGYAAGNYSSLIGGTNNSILGGDQNLILGGNDNSIFASANTGINTIINSWTSSILSGARTNLIIGGAYNQSSGDYNTTINGYGNETYGRYSNIFNGYENYISGSYSTILNGLRNIIESNNSVVLHGSDNEINKNNAVAIGSTNYIDHSGAVLISDLTSRIKISQAENSLSLNFANGVYLENDVSIYNLRLRNRKYTDYNYKTSNFVFSTYMNIVNSSSTIDAILPSVEDSRNFFVKNINSGALNITSTHLIDGQPSLTVYKNESVEFMGIIKNNYTGWIVIGGNGGVN